MFNPIQYNLSTATPAAWLRNSSSKTKIVVTVTFFSLMGGYLFIAKWLHGKKIHNASNNELVEKAEGLAAEALIKVANCISEDANHESSGELLQRNSSAISIAATSLCSASTEDLSLTDSGVTSERDANHIDSSNAAENPISRELEKEDSLNAKYEFQKNLKKFKQMAARGTSKNSNPIPSSSKRTASAHTSEEKKEPSGELLQHNSSAISTAATSLCSAPTEDLSLTDKFNKNLQKFKQMAARGTFQNSNPIPSSSISTAATSLCSASTEGLSLTDSSITNAHAREKKRNTSHFYHFCNEEDMLLTMGYKLPPENKKDIAQVKAVGTSKNSNPIPSSSERTASAHTSEEKKESLHFNFDFKTYPDTYFESHLDPDFGSHPDPDFDKVSLCLHQDYGFLEKNIAQNDISPSPNNTLEDLSTSSPYPSKQNEKLA